MKIQSFAEQVFNFLSEDPNYCANNGINKNLGELPEKTKNKYISEYGKICMLLNSMRHIDTDLDEDDRVDNDVLKFGLQSRKVSYEVTIDGVPKDYMMPIGTSLILDPIFSFFISDSRDPNLRLVNIISRLNKASDFLISYQRTLHCVQRLWLKMEIERILSAESLFSEIFKWAESINFKRIDLLDKAIKSAQGALYLYKTKLEQLDITDSIFLDDGFAEKIIASQGVNESIEEIHAKALSFLEENLFERKQLRNTISGEETLTDQELKDKLSMEYAFSSEIECLNDYKNWGEKLEKFCCSSKLFPIPKDQEIKIIKTPLFLEPTIPAGAMSSPKAFSHGKRESIVFLTINEKSLVSHNKIFIPPMMVHEGIPGHHLQFTHGVNHSSLARKMFYFNAFSEGWATFVEQYMVETDLFDKHRDKIKYIGNLDMARLGARVLIDLYFMTGDLKYLDYKSNSYNPDKPIENAIKLLQSITGFSDERALGEISWYTQESGYPLSYLIGYLNMKELKASSKMSDAEFFNRVLSFGNLPISTLRKVF